MRYRSVQVTPEGQLPREAVRDVVRGVHVIPLDGRAWEVRTMGVDPVQERFSGKTKALRYASSLAGPQRSKVVLHDRRSRPASVLEPARLGRD